MRFVLLYKSAKPEKNEPPSPQEMQAVGSLVQDMAQAGVLVGVEGFEPSGTGARIRINAGKFTVSDGPFPDGNGLLEGYSVVKVKSKARSPAASDSSRRLGRGKVKFASSAKCPETRGPFQSSTA